MPQTPDPNHGSATPSSSPRATPSSQEFEALVASHREAFRRLARKLTRDPEEAEDLLQETLVDAYRAFHRFQPGTRFYMWVGRIMNNNFLDRARKRRHLTISLDGPDAEPCLDHPSLRDDSANPEALVVEQRMAEPLANALASLQPVHRRTVELCDLEGATYEEAAAVTECPVGTIRSRLHRAHKAIRGFLERIHSDKEPTLPIERASSRRAFLRMSTAAAAGAAFAQASSEARADAGPLRVRVWFEGGTAHPDVTALLEGLGQDAGFRVTLASLDGSDQGLSDDALKSTDVLIWCARTRHDEVDSERVRAVARRVRHEGMGLIALHSAEGSRPFQGLVGGYDTPSTDTGPVDLALRVSAPRHPIANGLSGFELRGVVLSGAAAESTRPDVVVLDGKVGEPGNREWLGLTWVIGSGRVFSFRPGHAIEPVHSRREVRALMANAVRWAGNR